MKHLLSTLVIFISAASQGPPGVLPQAILGSWSVERPYDTRGPVGLTAKQEMHIRKLRLHYTLKALSVCGKTIPLQSVAIVSLTSDAFLQTYRFLPKTIGLDGSAVLEVSIHNTDMMNACGDYEGSPGMHLLLGQNRHVVMEVGNAYFPLRKH